MRLPPDTDSPMTAAAKLLILAAAFAIALLVVYPARRPVEPARKPVEAPKTAPDRVEPVSSIEQHQLGQLTERLTLAPTRPDARRFARAESGGNPHARNAHSTASGVLQFTDGTWAKSVTRWGKPLGVRLKDKNNPRAQLLIGQKLAEDNARFIARQIGREPTDGEVYTAHVFGARDGLKLIQAARQTPDRIAATLYPRELVKANRGIFYAGGKARTAAQLCQLLNDKIA